MPEAPNKEAIAARRIQAFELRKGGATFAAIGKALDISHTMARRDVNAVLDELTKDTSETIERSRRLQLSRLDDLLIGVWSAARRGDHAAIKSVLDIMARQAKLQGLDAAVKIDITDKLQEAARVYDLDADELIEIANTILHGAQ